MAAQQSSNADCDSCSGLSCPPAKRQRFAKDVDSHASAEGYATSVAIVCGCEQTCLLLPKAPLLKSSGLLLCCLGDDADEDVTSINLETELAPPSAHLAPDARLLIPRVLRWLVEVHDHADPPTLLGALSPAHLTSAAHLLALARFLLCDTLRGEVFKWLRQCKPNDFVDFLQRIMEQFQTHGGYSVTVLLSEGDCFIRLQAMEAFALMGEKASLYVSDVDILIQDANDSVRTAAAKAIAAMGPAVTQKYIGRIVALLHDTEAQPRAAACEVLGHCASVSLPHAATVAQLLKDDEETVRLCAASCLGSMGIEVVGLVLEQLQDADWMVGKAVAKALGGMGSAVSPRLLPLLSNQDANIRRAGVAAVRILGPDVLDLAADVAILLQDESRHVREEAAKALGAIGASAAVHTANVVALFEDANQWVRLAAVDAVGSFGKAARAHVDDMAWMLGDADWRVRRGAVKALVHIVQSSPLSTAYVPKLAQLLSDDTAKVVEEVVDGLVKMGAQTLIPYRLQMTSLLTEGDSGISDAVISAFAAMLNVRERPETREAAIASLRTVGYLATPLVPLIGKLLKDDDQHVRAEAADTLGAMGVPFARPYMQDIVELLKDPLRTVRVAAVNVLGLLGSTAAAHANDVSALLDDGCKSVRVAAAAAHASIVPQV